MLTHVLRRGACAAVLLIHAATTPHALAQGTGGGTICYIGPWANATSGGTAVMTTMSSNGSNQTQLGLGLFGPPSIVLYGNHRWFVSTSSIPNSLYPDGTQRSEVVAFRSDYHFELNNSISTRVQLTDDVTLQQSSPDWFPGGQEISFKGRRWSSAAPGATIVGGGLYTATLAFGIDGNIIGLVAQPTAPAAEFPLGSGIWPEIGTYTWHPSGDRVAYTGSSSSAGLWVANLLTGSRTRIHAGGTAHVQYSPDGTKIAFTNGNVGISTIKDNGSGLKEIIRRTSQWTFIKPYWDPSGSHIVCTGQGMTTTPVGMDVFRAAANGNFLTNLTNTAAPFNEWTVGWR